MKKLSDDLKRILTGLAYQDAGEFLSMRDKMKTLGGELENRPRPTPSRNTTRKSSTHCIAFISDGRGIGAPLAYAIEACSRLEAKLDLLIHGTTDTANICAIEREISAAGIGHQRIQLGTLPTSGITSYIDSHPSLGFLVALQDDPAVKAFLEASSGRQRAHMATPLVLIEDRPTTRLTRRSAA
jgi:hypothetical protein